MTKRLSTSLTQRLSGSRSIRACSDRRSLAAARAALSSVMSRPTPTSPQVSLRSLQGRFRRHEPLLGAGRTDYGLFPVDHRLSAAQDILPEVVEALSLLALVNIEVRQTDHFACVRAAIIGRQRHIGDDKRAVDILDPEMVGSGVNESLQQSTMFAACVNHLTKTRDLARRLIVLLKRPAPAPCSGVFRTAAPWTRPVIL